MILFAAHLCVVWLFVFAAQRMTFRLCQVVAYVFFDCCIRSRSVVVEIFSKIGSWFSWIELRARLGLSISIKNKWRRASCWCNQFTKRLWSTLWFVLFGVNQLIEIGMHIFAAPIFSFFYLSAFRSFVVSRLDIKRFLNSVETKRMQHMKHFTIVNAINVDGFVPMAELWGLESSYNANTIRCSLYSQFDAVACGLQIIY